MSVSTCGCTERRMAFCMAVVVVAAAVAVPSDGFCIMFDIHHIAFEYYFPNESVSARQCARQCV